MAATEGDDAALPPGPDVERDVLLRMLRASSGLLADRLAASPGGAAADSSPLSALAAARSLGAVLDDVVSSLVRQARAEGSSWAAVGHALGVSRQAAFQRFGRRSGVEPVTELATPDDAPQLARHALRQFLDRRFDELRAGFDRRMVDACGVELLRSVRSQLAAALGDEPEAGPPSVSRRMGYTVVDTPLASARDSCTVRLAFDAERRVAGFFVLDPETP